MIKPRPLMDVPRVVHCTSPASARTSPASPSGDPPKTRIRGTPRLPATSPMTAGGQRGPPETASDSKPSCPRAAAVAAGRKRWIISCPRDCRCRSQRLPPARTGEKQPKWLLDWQEGHMVQTKKLPDQAPDSPTSLGAEEQDVVEDLPLGGSSPPTVFRNTGRVIGRILTEPCGNGKLSVDDERPASTEAHSYRHHKSNGRPPRVFLPKSKTLGTREMAAVSASNDDREVDLPVTPWQLNRLVSDGAAMTSTERTDTLGSESVTSRTEGRRQSHVGFGTIILLSKKHGIPPQEVRQCAEEFRAFDTNRDGVLSIPEFEIAARKRCDLPPDEPIPDILRATMSKAAENRVDGCVGFEEYMLWVWQCIFMEEMSLTDSFERNQRNLARELGFDLPKLESLKEVFNSCDDDGSGFIEWPEFDQLVRCLLDAKEATDVSEALLRRYWKEANIGSTTGAIGFPDFVRWYAKNFA